MKYTDSRGPSRARRWAKKDTLLLQAGRRQMAAFAVDPLVCRRVRLDRRLPEVRQGESLGQGDGRLTLRNKLHRQRKSAKAEGGGDAATVKWVKGQEPFWSESCVLTLGAIAAISVRVPDISLLASHSADGVRRMHDAL